MRVHIASDHAGYELKARLAEHLGGGRYSIDRWLERGRTRVSSIA